MGLDMYLMKKTYIGNESLEGDDRLIISVPGRRGKAIKSERITEIIEEVGYWRKANAIHRWFVENVQDGVDECQESYVSHANMRELLDLCRQVISNPEKCEELLPSQSGFFFGNTDYDDSYLQGLHDTVSILTEELKSPEYKGGYILERKPGGDYYYRASW